MNASTGVVLECPVVQGTGMFVRCTAMIPFGTNLTATINYNDGLSETIDIDFSESIRIISTIISYIEFNQ